MGASFFLGIVAFLAFVYLCLLLALIAGTTLIIVWQVKSRKGKNPRNGLLVAATILLIINVIVVLVPVVLFGLAWLAG